MTNNITSIKVSNSDFAKINIDAACDIAKDFDNKKPLLLCIEKYGSKFVWHVAGNKLRAIGLKEEDLPSNDRKFLGEEHDMEN